MGVVRLRHWGEAGGFPSTHFRICAANLVFVGWNDFIIVRFHEGVLLKINMTHAQHCDAEIWDTVFGIFVCN